MRGICCECQTEQDLSPAFNPLTDDFTGNGWVMDWHTFAGQPVCLGVGSVPQAIVTKNNGNSSRKQLFDQETT